MTSLIHIRIKATRNQRSRRRKNEWVVAWFEKITIYSSKMSPNSRNFSIFQEREGKYTKSTWCIMAPKLAHITLSLYFIFPTTVQWLNEIVYAPDTSRGFRTVTITNWVAISHSYWVTLRVTKVCALLSWIVSPMIYVLLDKVGWSLVDRVRETRWTITTNAVYNTTMRPPSNLQSTSLPFYHYGNSGHQ